MSQPSVAQELNAEETMNMGTVDFEVSCTTDVSQEFDRAIALLHHMQYEQSRIAFEGIVQHDPTCAMAHWGIAMTLFQPLWPSRPNAETLLRGFNEIQTAQELGVESDRNAGLLAATAAFYQDPESADWWTRIQRWSDGMSEAYSEHPEDIETAVFYALSQLAVGPTSDDRLAYNAYAADVLESVYDQVPTHPGAIHYTIHANDVDSRANESLDIVRSYGEIAPAVPHALHMPTHIFVRLGLWPEVIEWNRRSADAALNFPASDGISHHYPHALDYMVYAYLQQGDTEQAIATLEEALNQEGPLQGTFITAFHLAAMPARIAVERRAWDEAITIIPANNDAIAWEKFFWPESLSWFANGLGAVHMNEPEQAEQAEARMMTLRDEAKAAGEEDFATYIEIDRLVLSAWRAYADGQDELAITLANEAVDLESTIQKHPVSPGALYPAQEALGDLLLDMEQAEAALSAYEASLSTWPGRFNSILGAARAAEAAEMSEQATEYYQALLALSTEERSNRAEFLEARQWLGE